MDWLIFKNTLRMFGLEHYKRYYASYRGTVADNKDPQKYGRIKLNIPQINDSTHDYWAWSKGMPAGNKIGLFLLPNVGDQVWVEFENGDVRYPIWTYGHWNQVNNPHAQMQTGDGTKNMVWASTSGHLIELDDTSGSEAIRITDKFGHVIDMKQGFVSVNRNDDKISLGADGGSAAPAVLGDKNADLLKNICQAILDIIQAIQTAGVTPMDGGATFKANLIASLTSTLTNLNQYKATDADQTKSQYVTLD